MPIPVNGEAKGSLALRSSGTIAPEDFLKYHPEIKAYLDDIVKQGWKYVFIDARGTAISQLTAENSRYWLGAPPAFMRKPSVVEGTRVAQPEFALVVYIGTILPKWRASPKSRYSWSTSPPRAFLRLQPDLVKGVVTYLHDPFWKWEKGWEADEKKLSDAREVYDIATWLVDVEKFKLIDTFKPARYQERVETFEALSQ